MVGGEPATRGRTGQGARASALEADQGPRPSAGARYHALLIPSCPGALADLASSGSLARILQHFQAEGSE